MSPGGQRVWRISEEGQEPVACATRPRAGQRRKVILDSNSVVEGEEELCV